MVVFDSPVTVATLVPDSELFFKQVSEWPQNHTHHMLRCFIRGLLFFSMLDSRK